MTAQSWEFRHGEKHGVVVAYLVRYRRVLGGPSGGFTTENPEKVRAALDSPDFREVQAAVKIRVDDGFYGFYLDYWQPPWTSPCAYFRIGSEVWGPVCPECEKIGSWSKFKQNQAWWCEVCGFAA